MVFESCQIGLPDCAILAEARVFRRVPERPRNTCVWTVAALREADERHPYDLAILGTLISIEGETGVTVAALGHARKLAEALPDDPQVKAMVAELSRRR